VDFVEGEPFDPSLYRLNLEEKAQHYPPGTQENYNSFPSRDLMMEKGKELECSRRAGGSGIREADSDEGSGNPSDF